MKSNTLKSLAQKAKKRLSSAGQNNNSNKDSLEEKVTSVYLSQRDYAIVASRQSIEDDVLFEKVKRVMQKGDIINPLAELTDQAVFNTLSNTEKEKYIIDISKRYNRIREYIINHN